MQDVYNRLPVSVRELFVARDIAVKGKGNMRTYLLDVLGDHRVAEEGLDVLASSDMWDVIMRNERSGSIMRASVG